MELTDLVRALRRHWIAALAGFLLVMLPALAAAYVPEKRYASRVTMSIAPSEGVSDDLVVNAAIQGFVARAKSVTLAREVAEALPADAVAAGASISAATDPAADFIIVVRVESSSPQAAKAWADGVADVLVAATNVETSAIQTSEIDEASLDPTPISPQTKQLIAGGGVVGILMAIVASAVAFRLQAQLDPAETIRTRLGSSLLGELPRPRFGSRSRRLVGPLNRAWPAGLEDAVQQLCTNLEVRLVGRDTPSVAIAGLAASTPVSDITSLVGWTLANGGRQVAVLDADITHPTLHERFGVPLRRGLSDVTAEGRPRAAAFARGETFQRHAVPIEAGPRVEGRLEVVSAGTGYYRPAEVMNWRLPLALAEAAESADLVLTVCPTLEESAEGWVAVASIPVAVLVVDSADLDVTKLVHTVTRLREQKVELLGVVLTGVKPRRRRPFRSPPGRPSRVVGEPPETAPRSRRLEATTRR
ncbi:MAG: hypothetical protein AB7O29_04480 [Acidimicrobiia bacterium]